MVRLLLADSNELIREGLKAVFNKTGTCEVVGEALSSAELIAKVEEFKPQVVLIDYTSPDFTMDVIPTVLEKGLDTKFVAITYLQTGKTIIDSIKSGVSSYIKKDCDLQEIVDAVVETQKGEKFFCGKILETIRNESITVEDIDYDPFSCAPLSLSLREQEIITLIAEGFTNTQIAEKLFLSAHTVSTHRKNIMAKLGVKNTAAIVLYAVKNHLVSPNKYLFS
jgi:DNA-binding NarL/FixJ family response regulator